MPRLLDILKQKPKTEILHGIVLEVNPGDARVKVILNNGIKTWIRYDEHIREPSVGDKLLVGGDIAKFVIRAVARSIPKDTNLLTV